MMIRNILIITVIAALVPTAMSSVSASASTEIAMFSSDSDSLSISGNGDNAKMELKATNENGKTKKVSYFQMDADNVLYIKVGDKVTVKDNAVFTKAITTDARDIKKAIGISSNGVIDFTGYAQGVYTLDVVVDDNKAYEAIIVIGQQTKEVVDKEITRVNNKWITEIEISFPRYSKEKPSVCYFNPKNPDCEPIDGKRRPGFGFNDDDRCVPHGKCPPGYVRADDDETGTCFEKGKDDRIKECPDGSIRLVGDTCYYESDDGQCEEGYELQNGICYEIRPEPEPNPEPPIYDSCGCPINQMVCPAVVCEPVLDPCIQQEGCEDVPILPVEPVPEPSECDDGEELVDGQCQLIPENPEEPIVYDELVTDQNEETNNEGEESNEEEEEEEEPEKQDQGDSEEESTDGGGSDDNDDTSA